MAIECNVLAICRDFNQWAITEVIVMMLKATFYNFESGVDRLHSN